MKLASQALQILLRADWGADPSLPRLGSKIGPLKRTEVFIHHTALAAAGDRPNEWSDLAQVRGWMQRLQTVRPDLGLDVPYNMVAFCMRDASLVLAEGRGLERVGAHTTDRNRSSLGIAFHGNFQREPLPRYINTQLQLLSTWLHALREQQGFSHLGNSRPGQRQVWGHRDVSATLCPGELMYNKLEQIRFITEDPQQAMDQATWKLVQRALQAQEPPLYGGKAIDGLPGRNTDIALQAFERRVQLDVRGVIGETSAPEAGIWPATRELLFISAGTQWLE